MTGVLPTATVTILQVGFEAVGADAAHLTSARGRLDRTVARVVAGHGGALSTAVSDGFVAGFPGADEALACAVDLQRAPLAPLRLRIAVHTGWAQLRQRSFVGPAVERATRLRDLAHGGQILLSEMTRGLVADRLPPDAWLIDVANHALPGAPTTERVAQLCHRDLVNDFPPLRTSAVGPGHGFPMLLTKFIGRRTELTELCQLIADHRLMTLTGSGGVGKTRLAVQLAGRLAAGFDGGVWYVDLASITDPGLVPISVARTFGLPDWPGDREDALVRFIADRELLVVLDNCEHLLDGCAALVTALLGSCPRLRMLATSREPIGVDGELTWPTPPLSLTDEAIQLFTDRARLAQPDFTVGGDNAAAVAEICRRLDGIPLAIELAAVRVRALSLGEILDGLHDRLRVLTGGARTAVPRHQTLRASVDWSHALLTERERVVLRRLAVFRGGFDSEAAHHVAGGAELPRYQTREELSQLVDKSLVVADDRGRQKRYRLLETVRQYAQEKLGESGESAAVCARHRDHYTALFATPVSVGLQPRVERAEVEIDNLRAAFTWSHDHGETELAAQLASSLQPLWLTGGRILEGLAWFDTVLTGEPALAPATRARALADKVALATLTGSLYRMDEAHQALAIARDLDDPALLAQALAACGFTCCYSPGLAAPYFAEAVKLAPALADDWRLSRIRGWQAFSAYVAGDLSTARAAAEDGLGLANAIGDGSVSRLCRWCIGLAQWLSADLPGATTQFREIAAEARTAHDLMSGASGLMALGIALAYQGDTSGAAAAAAAAIEAAADLPGFQQGAAFGALVDAALAAGDVATAVSASEAAVQACALTELLATNGNPVAKAALARGDVSAARRCADEAVSAATGVHRMMLLATRVRIAIADGEVDRAQRDAHDALAIAAETKAYLAVPDVLECLAGLAADSGSSPEAARLFGAAAAARERTGQVRFQIYDVGYSTAVAALRKALGSSAFDADWAAGTALSTAEAIGYARRGHRERKRPSRGWVSLTPTELDVVQLVGDGLSNKDIAARLFVSPRTVQTHLTHVYAKLGVTSRVQLVQEAARHG